MASNNTGNSNAIAGALTYPVSNDSSQLQPVPVQPRQPRNLEGLLRFAMEATKAEDATGNSQLGPIDEERRRFLNDALNAHTVRIDDVLRRNIKLLTNMERICKINPGDEVPEDFQLAFQELGEYVDDIDIANDFDKMSGFMIFPMCYSSQNVKLHRLANQMLAQVCQNNPNCQERALACCLLPVLLYRVREQQSEAKCLRALSSMIRDYEPGIRAFLSQGGCEALADTLRNPEYSELASAAFLITYLCRTNKEARTIFIKSNVIQAIVDILKANRSDASEYLLNVLVTLLELEPATVLPIFRQPALDLKRTMEDHLKIEDVKNGRFIEEKDYCEKIISVAFEGGEVNGKDEGQEVESADR